MSPRTCLRRGKNWNIPSRSIGKPKGRLTLAEIDQKEYDMCLLGMQALECRCSDSPDTGAAAPLRRTLGSCRSCRC